MPAGASDVLTTDGAVARLRTVTIHDGDALRALHDRASDEDVRFRFFSANRSSGDTYVDHLLLSLDRTLALVAVVADRVVGVGTAEPVGIDAYEVAFMIESQAHGRGLGSLLLEHLAVMARERGAQEFVADVLGDNHRMRRVFLDSGFALRSATRDGVTQLSMDLTLTGGAQGVADRREAGSEQRSLRPLLHPASVVVLGVRRDGTGVGAAVLDAVRTGGFTGDLHVVHPSAVTLAGLTPHASCVDLPGGVDLAVVAVPASACPAAMTDVAAAGIPAAIVLSSGFGEMGVRGQELQAEMLEIARAGNVRVVGPNCLGLMSNLPETRLNATFCDAVPGPGGLAVASQSGGVGIVLLEEARRIGLGVGCFVSLGNKADVSGNDLIAAWSNDPAVTSAALYLESFGNARKFARLARRFSRSKPLLAVVGGRSEGGRRAGASHTAAAATNAVAVDAMVAQTGVIRCEGAADLTAVALLLEDQPRPSGPRLGILTNAGGIGVLAADLAETSGLLVPSLGAEVVTALAGHLSGSAGAGNPVDTGAGAAPEDIAGAAEVLLGCDEIDTLLVVLVGTSLLDMGRTLGHLADVRRGHPDRPLALVVLGIPASVEVVAPGCTLFASYDAAVGSIAKVARYTAWLAVPDQAATPRDLQRARAARSSAAAGLRAATAAAEEGWLDQHAIRSLTAPYGLEPTGELVHGPDEAAAAAARTGFPVVVKVASTRVLHKTERGLVRLGLTSGEQVESAVTDFVAALGAEEEVLVQPVGTGVEIAVGLVRDPVFGPMVMVAAGGIALDVWNDRAFLMAPVSAADAARAVRSLRVWPLLTGHRGAAPVDVEALERVVVAVGQLGDEVPEVAELDLNPVLVTPEGCALVDVRLRLAAPGPNREARSLR